MQVRLRVQAVLTVLLILGALSCTHPSSKPVREPIESVPIRTATKDASPPFKPYCIAVDPSGSNLAVGHGRGLVIVPIGDLDYDPEAIPTSQALIYRFGYMPVAVATFGTEGSLAAGELDGSGGISVYLFRDSKLVMAFTELEDLAQLQFTKDGKILVAASYGTCVVTNVPEGKIAAKHEVSHSGESLGETSIELVPGSNGRLALIMRRSGTNSKAKLRFWNPISNAYVEPTSAKHIEEGDIPFISNGRLKAVRSSAVYELGTGSKLFSLDPPPASDWLKLDPSARWVAERSGDRKSLTVWSLSTGKLQCRLHSPSNGFSQDYQFIGPHAIANLNSPIEVFDFRSGTLALRILPLVSQEGDWIISLPNGEWGGTKEAGISLGRASTSMNYHTVLKVIRDVFGSKPQAD